MHHLDLFLLVWDKFIHKVVTRWTSFRFSVLSLTSNFVRAYMMQQHDTDYKYWYSGTGTWNRSTGTCTWDMGTGTGTWDKYWYLYWYLNGWVLATTLTHTHTFNDPFSGTTQVSWYQKSKTNLDSTKARDSEWQWHQLGYKQVCTLLQTDNHTNTLPLSFYRPGALPAAQPAVSKHWKQKKQNNKKW